MNSREKGKRGERAWRDELRAQGFQARRGQQFAGGPDSPDVLCETLPFHFEVKCVEHLNIYDAMAQALRDSQPSTLNPQPGDRPGRLPIVAHRRNYRPWLVTMQSDTFFRLLRGDLQSATNHSAEQSLANSNNNN